jgi:hypothetical protein
LPSLASLDAPATTRDVSFIDGRGALPWLLVLTYAAIQTGYLLLLSPAADFLQLQVVAIILGVAVLLAATGPVFLVLFLVLLLHWLTDQNLGGGCRAVHTFDLLFIPCLALPGACLTTARLIYQLGREALNPQSRHLGNIILPLIAFLAAQTMMMVNDAQVERLRSADPHCFRD